MKLTMLTALMLVTITCSAQMGTPTNTNLTSQDYEANIHLKKVICEHNYLPTGEQLTSYPPIDIYKCSKCGDVKRVQQSSVFREPLKISVFTINGKPYSIDKRRSTTFIRYQLWDKPTRTHITGVIDSVQVEQRKHYTFYYTFLSGFKIATFTKYETGTKVSWYLKRLID